MADTPARRNIVKSCGQAAAIREAEVNRVYQPPSLW